MTDPHKRPIPASAASSADRGGENTDPDEAETTHTGAPHDDHADEPLGPFTPDDETPLGDSPELHDEIVPQDLPKDHPGRKEAERQAAENGGIVHGNT